MYIARKHFISLFAESLLSSKHYDVQTPDRRSLSAIKGGQITPSDRGNLDVFGLHLDLGAAGGDGGGVVAVQVE